METAEELVADWSLVLLAVHQQADHAASFPLLLTAVRANGALSATLLVDAGGTPIEDAAIQATWLVQVLLVPFVSYYLDLRPDATWDDATFDEIFRDVTRQLQGEPLQFRQIAPLTKARSTNQRIELDDRTAIITVSDDAATDLFDRLGRPSWGQFGITDVMHWTLAIEHVVDQARDVVFPQPDQNDRTVVVVLTALRLLRESGIATATTVTDPVQRTFGVAGGSFVTGFATLPLSPFAAGVDLEIGEDDEPTLRSIYERLQTVEWGDAEARRRFELALNRLNTSAGRFNPEDRLIDYWVAIESLFANDGRAEITYRARTRVARYVSEQLAERKKIASLLSRSYTRRSAVVHGDPPKPDLQQVATETGEILRRALRRMLESGKQVDVDVLDLG
jgi:Apea-like HEPN